MNNEFLRRYGIEVSRGEFVMPYYTLQRIAEELELDFEHGSILSFTMRDGEEVNVAEATVH